MPAASSAGAIRDLPGRAPRVADPTVVARFVGDFRSADREFAQRLDDSATARAPPVPLSFRGARASARLRGAPAPDPEADGRGLGRPLREGFRVPRRRASGPRCGSTGRRGCDPLVREIGAGVVAAPDDVDRSDSPHLSRSCSRGELVARRDAALAREHAGSPDASADRELSPPRATALVPMTALSCAGAVPAAPGAGSYERRAARRPDRARRTGRGSLIDPGRRRAPASQRCSRSRSRSSAGPSGGDRRQHLGCHGGAVRLSRLRLLPGRSPGRPACLARPWTSCSSSSASSSPSTWRAFQPRDGRRSRSSAMKGLVKFAIHFAFLVAAVAHLSRRGPAFYWRTLGWFVAGIVVNSVYSYGVPPARSPRRRRWEPRPGRSLGPIGSIPAREASTSSALSTARTSTASNALTLDPNHLGDHADRPAARPPSDLPPARARSPPAGAPRARRSPSWPSSTSRRSRAAASSVFSLASSFSRSPTGASFLRSGF